jgi:replicative DNA helicase
VTTTAEPDYITDTPSHDRHAEQAVLGALILDNQLIDTIPLTPADFYEPAHGTIYATVSHMHGASQRVDPITLAAELRTSGDLARVGGQPYLMHLVQQTPTAANADYYAGIVREAAALRAIHMACLEGAQRARIGEATADEIRDHALAALQATATGIDPASEKLSVADRWQGFLAELEMGRDPNAIDTPWPDLNDVVELKPGQLVTVGATTGGGKSLLGLNLAAHVALNRGKPVLFASLEMGGSELLARLTAAEASVDLGKLMRRQLDDFDWQKIIRAADRLQNVGHLVLDDTPNLSVAKIRTRIRWMITRGQAPAMVVADYLQLMSPEASKKDRTRANEVAEISRGLKLLAMEFDVPVIALAQFNRNHVGRQPLISDFKDSSSIEQDSNVILLMHRPLAEDGTDTGPRAGEIDVIVAKNRNGANGRVVPLTFQGHFARLRSMGRV